MTKLQYIHEKFKTEIGTADILVKVPGRANIIGEHIDYCGGIVMPFALEQSMYFVVRRRPDNTINVKALDIEESFTFSLLDKVQTTGWRSYFCTAIQIMSAEYDISGVDIYFNSDIPIGAGVSSSSALCVGIIYTIDHLYQLGLTKMKMVDIASQAEHGMGIRGGIMDQYTILHGERDKALLIDCDAGTHSLIDLSSNPYQWILFNTNVKHDLVHTPYNDRRSQVEEALSIINERINSNKQFTEITESDLALLDDKPTLQKRINHIYSEIQRVEKAKQSIQSNNFNNLGQLLNTSHQSLSEDYEVSCAELDFVCKTLQGYDQVLGCRMMGGGFGGSVIALVNRDFDSQTIKTQYVSQFGLGLDVIPVTASEGVVRMI